MKLTTGAAPQSFDTTVELDAGVHVISYKVQSKNGVGNPVTCSHKVTVGVHTCTKLNIAENMYLGPINDKIKTNFIGCKKADSETQSDMQEVEAVSTF